MVQGKAMLGGAVGGQDRGVCGSGRIGAAGRAVKMLSSTNSPPAMYSNNVMLKVLDSIGLGAECPREQQQWGIGNNNAAQKQPAESDASRAIRAE